MPIGCENGVVTPIPIGGVTIDATTTLPMRMRVVDGPAGALPTLLIENETTTVSPGCALPAPRATPTTERSGCGVAQSVALTATSTVFESAVPAAFCARTTY